MTKEQLFEVIGEAEEVYVRDAAEGKKHKAAWVRWCALAACLALAVGTVLWQVPPGGAGEQEIPPIVTYNGVEYMESGYASYRTALSELPAGYVLAGTTVMGQQGECPFYANPEEPLWVYVYCTVYSTNSYEPPKMGYVRFVDVRLRSAEMICYNGQLYIGMMSANLWSSENNDVEQELYDALEAEYSKAFEGEAPEGFVCLGEVEYTGPDTLPSGELAGNIKAVVWAHPDRPELLLKETYWHSFTEQEMQETRHHGFEVFALYTGPLA
ncbi:MAG: hypothetical protein E7469_02705 [Ruminococcaceae bacterium]|nr:hypothetical protein [Oscillospiraceae bacterium]